MKKTSKEFMEWLGLQVGDKVRVNLNKPEEIFTITKLNDEIRIENENYCFSIKALFNTEYDIIPKPKRVGDTLCQNVECEKCPLRMVVGCENVPSKYTLYQCLEEIKDCNENNNMFDQEIYDLLLARLDKVVE